MQGSWEWLKLGKRIEDYTWLDATTQDVMDLMQVRRWSDRGPTGSCCHAREHYPAMPTLKHVPVCRHMHGPQRPFCYPCSMGFFAGVQGPLLKEEKLKAGSAAC